jgi:hypothetical protein
MKNRIYLVSGVLLVVAAGWVLWSLGASRLPPEPVYNGKRLGYWLDHPPPPPPVGSIRVESYGDDPSAWQMQVQKDSNAVPFLILALKRDRWLGAALYRKWLWPKLPASARAHLPMPADDKWRRGEAAGFLGGMGGLGPAASPAIPALARALREDDSPTVRHAAVWPLHNLGRSDGKATATAALSAALTDKDYSVRRAATNALLVLNPEAAAIAGVTMPPP